MGRTLMMVGIVRLLAWPVLAQTNASPPAAQEYQRGRALYERKEYESAAQCFEKAVALAPANSEYAQWLGRADGLQAEHASLLARPGLALRSRDALERAVKLDPDNVGARSDLAAYYAAAPGFLGGGAAKARAQVAEIRRRDPYLGQVRAADLLWDDHRLAAAKSALQEAVRRDPRRPEARGRLGTMSLDEKQYPQAFAEWDAMLSVDPARPSALYGLGRTAALSGQRTAEGENALRTFLGAPGSDPEGLPMARAHLYLGMLLEQRGERDEARSEYEKALRLEADLPEAKQALSSLKR